MNLTILHTNDLHGRVDQLARLATLAETVRDDATVDGGAVLLVDGGDAEEKSLLESDVTKGAAMMSLLNAAGYQAMAVGNGAPLSYGPQVLAGMAEAADFPILAANFTWVETGAVVEGVQPAELIDIAGLKIGLIGLAPVFRFWALFGVDVPRGHEQVQHYSDSLRSQGAMFIVVLSHQGSASDRELAKAVDGLDVIVGGHAHEELPDGIWEGDTLICQAGDYGRYLGRIDLKLDNQGRVYHKQARLLPVPESTQKHPCVVAEYRRQQERVAGLLEEPVGRTTGPLPLAALSESAMGNFLADVLRDRMDADLALCISGSLNSGLPSGTVTLGDMFAACSSPGNPGITHLRGIQIREMLEVGMDPDRARQRPHFLRGRPLGVLAVSGGRVWIDPSAPAGQRIQRVEVAGKPLQDDGVYSIAASDFEMGGMTYQGLEETVALVSFTIPAEEVRYDLPTVLREAMQDYLRRHAPLDPPNCDRVVVIDQSASSERHR